MEATSIYAISSVASAVASSPMGGLLGGWIYHKFKKWRLKKRLSGVLLLKGVSTLCQKLSNTEVLFFDIDTIYRELTAPKEAADHKEPSVVENYTAYPILRTHVWNLTNIYKGQIVIVSHNLELLRAVGVYNENITFFAFSKEMERNIGVIFPSEIDRAHAELTKFRTLRELPETQVVIVNNLNDLEVKLKEKYHMNNISV
jgi:hypothetical protein